jgi:Tfp pilus assembly protein PilE
MILLDLAIAALVARIVLPHFGNYVARSERRVRHYEFLEPPH